MWYRIYFYFKYRNWSKKIFYCLVEYLIKSSKVWNLFTFTWVEWNRWIFNLPKHISISPLWNLVGHRYDPIVFTQSKPQAFLNSSHSLISEIQANLWQISIDFKFKLMYANLNSISFTILIYPNPIKPN